MNIDERVKIAIQNKYYGELLTDRQRQVIKMYVDDNLSLAEVSTELNISRQAVKDALDTALEQLSKFEDHLHFISRDDRIKALLDKKSPKEIDMVTRLQILSILEE